jgi:23S rRNA (guanosine2251-2'-O)-methyltransferase
MTQIEGRNPVFETLKRGGVLRLMIAKGSEKQKRIQEILELAIKKEVEVEFVRTSHLNKISQTWRHQGVIALSETPGYASLEAVLQKTKEEVCIIILDKVQDPQNLGSILRTSEAAGVDTVVVPRKESVGLTPTVLRISMGGGISVPVAKENLYTSVKLLRDEGVRLVGVDPSGIVNYWDMDLTGSVAFILGGEAKGISPTLLGKCDSIIRIPMTGRIKSLNVGVSAALILYERLRQINKKN